MNRLAMLVSAVVLVGASAGVSEAQAIPLPRTFDVLARGIAGSFDLTFDFQASGGSMSFIQTGSVAITSETGDLPDATGTYFGLGSALSIWSVNDTSSGGLVQGTGIAVGPRLTGTLLVAGVPESNNGFYILHGRLAATIPQITLRTR